MNLACVCDRCGSAYGVPAESWPGKALCRFCDLSIPVWQKVVRLPERGAA